MSPATTHPLDFADYLQGPAGPVHREESFLPQSLAFWMAMIYLALFLLRPWEILFPGLKTIPVERIYAICMVIVVGLEGFRLRWTSQTMAVLAFLGAVVLSWVFAYRPLYAENGCYIYLTVVVFYFVLLSVIRSPRDLYVVIICYIAVMTLYLAKSEWEYFVHGRHWSAQGVRRLVGIERSYGEPNALAMSIVASLPLHYFLFQYRRQLTDHWPAGWRNAFRWMLPVYAILAISSLFLTNSRAGLVSLAVFVVLITWRSKDAGQMFRRLLAGAIILASLWLLASDIQRERFQSLWDEDVGPTSARRSAEGRVAGFWAGMAMFERFPWTGVGVGNFLVYRVRHLDGVPKVAHNLPGQLLGEMGLLGGICFGWLVAAAWLNGRRLRRLAASNPDPELEVLGGLGVACIHVLILMFVQGFSLHNVLRFNWLWVAAFSSLGMAFAREILLRCDFGAVGEDQWYDEEVVQESIHG